MNKNSAGGMVYLDERQSKDAAEHVLHAMEVIRKDMDDCHILAQRIACAETIAELAKSLQAMKPIFWFGEGVER